MSRPHLIANFGAGLRYLAYTGNLELGTVVTVSYHSARFEVELYVETMTFGASGVVDASPLDFGFFARKGDTLRIRVRWGGGGVSTAATAIEYGLIAA